uniref:AB hydrolase-1 domain-containing protein n=1 Tax=Strigops habroptila TaxID=2489341 RepID=A0A672TRR2_STRHB
MGMFSEVKVPCAWGHVAAKAWGSSEGHPVLCLHGRSGSAGWVLVVLQGCYYVAMDFSGHGLSSHRPAGCPYHFLDYVSDVRRWQQVGKRETVSALPLSSPPGISPRPFASAASCSFPKQPECLLSPCHAIFASLPPFSSSTISLHVSPRLLEANRHLTAEGGAILLQRGATETPAGKGLHGDRAHRSAGPALVWTGVVPTAIVFHRVHLSKGMLSRSTSSCVLSFQHIQLVEVPGSHFVHLNTPEVVSGIISNFLIAQNTRARL